MRKEVETHKYYSVISPYLSSIYNINNRKPTDAKIAAIKKALSFQFLRSLMLLFRLSYDTKFYLIILNILFPLFNDIIMT